MLQTHKRSHCFSTTAHTPPPQGLCTCSSLCLMSPSPSSMLSASFKIPLYPTPLSLSPYHICDYILIYLATCLLFGSPSKPKFMGGQQGSTQANPSPQPQGPWEVSEQKGRKSTLSPPLSSELHSPQHHLLQASQRLPTAPTANPITMLLSLSPKLLAHSRCAVVMDACI